MRRAWIDSPMSKIDVNSGRHVTSPITVSLQLELVKSRRNGSGGAHPTHNPTHHNCILSSYPFFQITMLFTLNFGAALTICTLVSVAFGATVPKMMEHTGVGVDIPHKVSDRYPA